MTHRRYHWPTDEGWFFVIVLTVAGFAAGGWKGALLMFGFFVLTSILGNVVLP